MFICHERRQELQKSLSKYETTNNSQIRCHQQYSAVLKLIGVMFRPIQIIMCYGINKQHNIIFCNFYFGPIKIGTSFQKVKWIKKKVKWIKKKKKKKTMLYLEANIIKQLASNKSFAFINNLKTKLNFFAND